MNDQNHHRDPFEERLRAAVPSLPDGDTSRRRRIMQAVRLQRTPSAHAPAPTAWVFASGATAWAFALALLLILLFARRHLHSAHPELARLPPAIPTLTPSADQLARIGTAGLHHEWQRIGSDLEFASSVLVKCVIQYAPDQAR